MAFIETKQPFFEELLDIFQKNVINIDKKDILSIYDAWNKNFDAKEELYDKNSVRDKKLIAEKQYVPNDARLLGIDFSTWFGDFNWSKRIMIVGIDPLRNEATFKKAKADPNEDVILGTPYGFHIKKLREGRCAPYWSFVNELVENKQCFVYLTDIYKTFFYTKKEDVETNTQKMERSYVYYGKKNVEKNKTALEVEVKATLEAEIKLINPTIIITLGGESYNQLMAPKLTQKSIGDNRMFLKEKPNISVLPMVHLSGATRNDDIEAFLEINGIDISENKNNREQYGKFYAQIINKYLEKI